MQKGIPVIPKYTLSINNLHIGFVSRNRTLRLRHRVRKHHFDQRARMRTGPDVELRAVVGDHAGQHMRSAIGRGRSMSFASGQAHPVALIISWRSSSVNATANRASVNCPCRSQWLQ